MTLSSALEDLQATTLKAIAGTLRKLEYLARLRKSGGGYAHWGLARVHGELAASRALEQEHRALVSKVLCSPLENLLMDAEQSGELSGLTPASYVKKLMEQDQLLPTQPGAGAERHLSSVLQALSALAETRSGAIHPTS
jgi:hypothetical protein